MKFSKAPSYCVQLQNMMICTSLTLDDKQRPEITRIDTEDEYRTEYINTERSVTEERESRETAEPLWCTVTSVCWMGLRLTDWKTANV